MAARLIGWGEFFIAFVLFFLSHIIPVRPAIRDWLIRRIGKPIYLAVYSVLSIVLFGWLIVAADRAPYVAVWNFSPWQLWLPNIAMPIACFSYSARLHLIRYPSHPPTMTPSSRTIQASPALPGTRCCGQQRFGRSRMQCQTAISPTSYSLICSGCLASWACWRSMPGSGASSAQPSGVGCRTTHH